MLNKLESKILINNNYYKDLHFIFKKKLLSSFLKRGNKLYALKLFNNLKYILKSNTKIDSNLLFLNFVLNSLTKFHFIKKRKGGSIKEIPIPITDKRQIGSIIKILIRFSKSKRTFNPNLKKIIYFILVTNKNKGPFIVRKYRFFRKAFDNKFLLHLIRK